VRLLIVALFAVILGAMGGSMAVKALSRHSAYPRGVMNVMEHHYQGLRRSAGLAIGESPARPADACGALADRQLTLIRLLADDVSPTLVGATLEESELSRWAGELRTRTDAALARSARDCATLATVVRTVGEACDGCHRRYR